MNKPSLAIDDEIEGAILDLERMKQEAEVSATAPKPFRPGTSFSWAVQMRDGRVLRVDGASCSTTNGILVFSDMHGGLIAAFEYGDWKRVSAWNRESGEIDGWSVLKDKTPKVVR